jgi:hypothetical protein
MNDDRREERQRQRETEPPAPLDPNATDPTADEPHHALNNPADEPDPTEFPDPYERRPDPRGPEADADREDRDDSAATPRPPSTSEPHPPRNYDDVKPEKGG